MKAEIKIINAFIKEKQATLNDIRSHPMYKIGAYDTSIILMINVAELESQIKVLKDVKTQINLLKTT